MNFKTVGVSSILVLMFLTGSFGFCMSEDIDAEASVDDWARFIFPESSYYNSETGTVNTASAVHISNLNAVIPIDETKTWQYLQAKEFTYNTGISGYAFRNSINLTVGDNFSKLESAFANSELTNYVMLVSKDSNGAVYQLLVCFDAVYKYDVTGTLSAGTSDVSISATAKMATEANAKLSTPMFYVIAHYDDGKFISTYISATAAEDGTLTLANMGVSKTGLVDVMVGVVGAVPSDDPTVYYGERVLTLATA